MEASTVLFKETFDNRIHVTLSEKDGQKRLYLRLLDGSYPAKKYIWLPVDSVKNLILLKPHIFITLAAREDTFYDLGNDIRLSVTKGNIDIRLRWLPPNRTEKGFTKKGVNMNKEVFEKLSAILASNNAHFL